MRKSTYGYILVTFLVMLNSTNALAQQSIIEFSQLGVKVMFTELDFRCIAKSLG
jgi:hypothetical protein